MTELKVAHIDRWIRPGKSIKCGANWYTVKGSSKVKQKLWLSMADWELERGKSGKDKMLSYEQLLKHVNDGSWMVKIQDKPVGEHVMQEDTHIQQSVELVRSIVRRRRKLDEASATVLVGVRKKRSKVKPKTLKGRILASERYSSIYLRLDDEAIVGGTSLDAGGYSVWREQGQGRDQIITISGMGWPPRETWITVDDLDDFLLIAHEDAPSVATPYKDLVVAAINRLIKVVKAKR